jgi:hypothetical protein
MSWHQFSRARADGGAVEDLGILTPEGSDGLLGRRSHPSRNACRHFARGYGNQEYPATYKFKVGNEG